MWLKPFTLQKELSQIKYMQNRSSACRITRPIQVPVLRVWPPATWPWLPRTTNCSIKMRCSLSITFGISFGFCAKCKSRLKLQTQSVRSKFSQRRYRRLGSRKTGFFKIASLLLQRDWVWPRRSSGPQEGLQVHLEVRGTAKAESWSLPGLHTGFRVARAVARGRGRVAKFRFRKISRDFRYNFSKIENSKIRKMGWTQNSILVSTHFSDFRFRSPSPNADFFKK